MECGLCSSKLLILVKRSDIALQPSSEQFRVSDSNYGKTGNLHKCSDCQFVQCFDFINPGSFYEEMSDEEYVVSQGARYKEMSQIMNFAHPLLTGAKSLLDIGAGTGMLVKRAIELGYFSQGIEPSKQFCEVAQHLGLPIKQGVFPADSNVEKFDVITLIDVIEHVNSPLNFLAQVKGNLNPHGFVVISTPDCSSVVAKLLKWKWWHYRIAHIGYFNQYLLDQAMAKCGFKLIGKSRPSWYFNLDYVLERILKFSTNKQFKIPILQAIQIRINLRDSILCVYQAE